ncbi:Zinc ABC transporter, periplasmic-binding protein ZnuA [hydrothermal vent metagenome]|uniref:Zinc ABC transporter, periplasmic-binding protein ZnuA n=1 Tax=hydrothermal vent metagenome TaxID=652676 RepID=A0A1W1EEV8_9ZZZZ
MTSTFILANMNVVVSILPEQTFVKKIGGDKVNVSLMVLPGNSPHTYEPKPSQMKNIAKASLYFAIGVEFENIWLEKFKNLNRNMIVIDLTKDIEKINMASHHHEHDSHKEEAHHEHSSKDPHIWTSPKNVKVIAKNIYLSLAENDPENGLYYKANYENFIEEINILDSKIKNILSKKKSNSKFMVFHPSWGYFARDYNLKQLAIELEGKTPKPKELIMLIKEAKEENISAIFTQPEFSDEVSKVMANELKIEVIKVSPLAKNWEENLLNISNAIAGNH